MIDVSVNLDRAKLIIPNLMESPNGDQFSVIAIEQEFYSGVAVKIFASNPSQLEVIAEQALALASKLREAQSNEV